MEILKNVSLKDFIEKPYIKHRAEPGNKTVLGNRFHQVLVLYIN
jgi:hypothetical protein